MKRILMLITIGGLSVVGIIGAQQAQAQTMLPLCSTVCPQPGPTCWGSQEPCACDLDGSNTICDLYCSEECGWGI